MTIQLSSRDASGQLVTVDYTPGTEPPAAGAQGDASAASQTGSLGATPESPAGTPEPSAPPADSPPAGAGESPAETEDEDEPLRDAADVTAERLNRRFARLTAARRKAERERDALAQQHALELAQTRGQLEMVQRMLSGAAPPLPETPAAPAGPPQAEQFASHEDYVLAAARYGAQQELQAREAQTQAERQRQQQAAFQQQLIEREAAFKQAHPDFDDRVRAGLAGKVSPTVQQALMLIPDGPAVAYALATQPELVKTLNMLPPPLVLVELGKLSGPITAVPPTLGGTPPANGIPTPTSTASAPSSPAQQPLPPPATPLSGAGASAPTFSPAAASQAELRKRWNAGWRPSANDFSR